MDFFTIDITEAVGVGVEADGGVEGGFAAGKPEADVGVSTTGRCRCGWVLGSRSERMGRRWWWWWRWWRWWSGCGECGGVYSTDNLAFVVPVSLPGADVCPSHAEALGGGEGGAGAG